jgi:large subunit ribosomal protein L6
LATSIKEEEQEIFAEVDIPENVEVRMEGSTVIVGGKLGTLKKDLTKLPIAVDIKDKKLVIKPPGTRKKDLAITNTTKSIIQSMIKGVERGFTYKLKVVYAHFPISVKTKGKEIHVENYFGERAPRVSYIVGDATKVNVVGEDVVVQGPSLEDVSQTAANIEFSTKLKGKDQRVFLDGLYIYSREEGIS